MTLAQMRKVLQNLKQDTVKMTMDLVKVNAALTNLINSLDFDMEVEYFDKSEEINNNIFSLSEALSTFVDTLDIFERHGRPFMNMETDDDE